LRILNKRRRLALSLAAALLLVLVTMGNVLSSHPPFDHGTTRIPAHLRLLVAEEEGPVYAALMSHNRPAVNGRLQAGFGWVDAAAMPEELRGLAAGYLSREAYQSGRVPSVPVPATLWMFGSGIGMIAGLWRRVGR
jgi:hypothetical protein